MQEKNVWYNHMWFTERKFRFYALSDVSSIIMLVIVVIDTASYNAI